MPKACLRHDEGGGRCVRDLHRPSPTFQRTQRPIQVAGRIGWGWVSCRSLVVDRLPVTIHTFAQPSQRPTATAKLQGGDPMHRLMSTGAVAGFIAAALAAAPAAADIKIGTIYDYTGPFAAGGSKPAAIGNKIAIDMINEKG